MSVAKKILASFTESAPLSTSSGSSYQGVLRPITLRARQRIDFGASCRARVDLVDAAG